MRAWRASPLLLAVTAACCVAGRAEAQKKIGEAQVKAHIQSFLQDKESTALVENTKPYVTSLDLGGLRFTPDPKGVGSLAWTLKAAKKLDDNDRMAAAEDIDRCVGKVDPPGHHATSACAVRASSSRRPRSRPPPRRHACSEPS